MWILADDWMQKIRWLANILGWVIISSCKTYTNQLWSWKARYKDRKWCSGRCTAQHSTAPHRTAPHRTAPHRTAPHSTAQHSTAQHSTAQHSTAQYSTVQYTSALRPCVLPSSLSMWRANFILVIDFESDVISPVNRALHYKFEQLSIRPDGPTLSSENNFHETTSFLSIVECWMLLSVE